MKVLFVHFLLRLALITVIIGLIYASVQQGYRTAANDPQIQVVKSIINKLRKGVSFEKIIGEDTIDISSDLSTFITLYNSDGKPIASTGYLDGKMLQLPQGIFAYLGNHDDDMFSWQPRSGIRMAMVVKRSTLAPVAFVAAGRSLQQTEIREHMLGIMMITGWLICLVMLTIISVTDGLKLLRV